METWTLDGIGGALIIIGMVIKQFKFSAWSIRRQMKSEGKAIPQATLLNKLWMAAYLFIVLMGAIIIVLGAFNTTLTMSTRLTSLGVGILLFMLGALIHYQSDSDKSRNRADKGSPFKGS